MIGFFALFCPLIVIQLEDFVSRFKSRLIRRLIVSLVAGACLINFGIAGTVNWKLDTKEYPRTYFYHVGNIRNIYETICDTVRDRGYRDIGLACGINSYEYPLWGLLQYDEQEYKIKHVLVDGILKKYEDEYYKPDCIIMVDRSEEENFVYNSETYRLVDSVSEEEVNVYMYERVNDKE